MGGALLKKWNLPENRLNPNDYKRLANSVIQTLKKNINKPEINFFEIGVAPSLRKKESHGDLDITVGMDHLYVDWGKNNSSFSEFIFEEYKFIPHQNSNVYSFPVEGFQVDVTFVSPKYFQSSVNYNSWGDTSNLMGRIFHKMGLHYGHTGLSFWIRQGLFDSNVSWSDNDHIYSKFVLTTDMKDICRIGGFDYNTWQTGFDTEEDAFRFIINSKYFSRDLFALENLNHINRIRNRKRTMYMNFLQYLEEKNVTKTFEFLSKENYSILFQRNFDELRRAIDEARYEYHVTKCCKEKLNGNLVHEMFPELEGRQIGALMKTMRENLTVGEILEMPKSEMIKLIRQNYEEMFSEKS